MGKIHNGKLLYHLTKLSNLDSIIENGLVSRRILLDNSAGFDDVADPAIMSKRTELGLDEYVPFHFHPYSSFDVAVKNTYRDDDFIYICIYRQLAKDNDFVIVPRHPLNSFHVELLSYEDGFEAIDWESMERSSTESDYIHDVRMAECLTNKVIPVNCFQSIAVKDESIQEIVEAKLRKYDGKIPHVNIRPWLNIDDRRVW